MMEATTFENQFPEGIPRGSMRSLALKLSVILLGGTFFLVVDAPSGVAVVIAIAFFSIPSARINAIRLSLEQCRAVIEENKTLSEENDELSPFLLTEQTSLSGRSERLKFLYILAAFTLPLFFIFRSFGLEPLDGSINFISYYTVLVIGSSINDLRNFEQYLLSVYELNSKMISVGSFQETVGQKVLSTLQTYKKKLDVSILLVSATSIALVALLLLRVVTFKMLILIPVTLFIFAMIWSLRFRELALASFNIFRLYDDNIKAKHGLSYEPMEEMPRKGFVQQVKSKLEEEGFSGVTEQMNRDIRDRGLFK